MAEYDEEVFTRLFDIAQRHRNCLDEHEDIILQCPKKLMSRGIDLYGMFWPDMEIGKYITYKGRLTKNEKSRHYSYYFDEQDRLRLTERFDDDGTILNYIFYYYNENSVEIVWYSFREKDVYITGFIDYVEGKISRFVESGYPQTESRKNKKERAYREYLFDVDPNYVLDRTYAENLLGDGTIWEPIGKLRKH